MPTPRSQIVLESGRLAQLANKPEFVREFPFLKPLAGLTGCGRCGKAKPLNREAFNTAKQSLNALSREQKEKFKSMLKTRAVVLKTRRDGKTLVHKF